MTNSPKKSIQWKNTVIWEPCPLASFETRIKIWTSCSRRRCYSIRYNIDHILKSKLLFIHWKKATSFLKVAHHEIGRVYIISTCDKLFSLQCSAFRLYFYYDTKYLLAWVSVHKQIASPFCGEVKQTD